MQYELFFRKTLDHNVKTILIYDQYNIAGQYTIISVDDRFMPEKPYRPNSQVYEHALYHVE